MNKNSEKDLFHYFKFSKKDEKNYPVITEILKQLTPELREQEIKSIKKIDLPDELQEWVREYKKIGERDEFIFLWLYQVFQVVTLPISSNKYQYSLWKVKFLISIFTILLDDVVDKTSQRRLFKELMKIPYGEEESFRINLLNQKEQEYFNFANKLWDYIEEIIKKYPKYNELKEILEFDIFQLLNTMRYNFLLKNNPYLINKVEYWLYSSYSEIAMICFTLDLMCSYTFDTREINIVRECGWQAQKMARIGDCISTWTREVKEGDFTSGVFIYAVRNRVLTVDDLIKKDPIELIEKIKKSKIESFLLQEWEEIYQEFIRLLSENKKLNKEKVSLIPKKLIKIHLSSRKDY